MTRLRHTGALLLCLLVLAGPLCAESTSPAGAEQLLAQLAQADNARESIAALEALAASGHPRAGFWIQAFGDGKLARVESTGRLVVILENRGRDWTLEDALDPGEPFELSRRDLDRLRVNNALRREVAGLLSTMDLDAESRARRLAAARDLRGRVQSPVLAGRLEQRLEKEPDDEVREALETVLAIYRLEQGDAGAVAVLAGSLSTEARSALQVAANGPDPELAEKSRQALAQIEQLLTINRTAETLYFGLSLGSVLALAAIGLAVTFGVMGVINMAHGELIMLGAYTTWGMQQLLPGQPGLALVLAIPAGFLVSGVTGIAMERGIIRHLKGRPLETLLATFGVSLILQQLVRTVVSPLNRVVVSPEWMSGSIMVNEALSLTLNRLFVIGFALLVFAGLLLVMRRTRLGLEVRAVTQNRAMARAMGIRAARVDMLTFGLGSGVAGLAGVALSQLTNVGPNMGQNYIIDSFMVVVFGGVGNLWGTLVAGLSLGSLNQWLEPWAGSVLAKILVLVFIILFIQKRPRGLFPQKGRAVEG